MKKLMSTLLVAMMAFGMFMAAVPQPVSMEANSDLFKDFDVSINPNGDVTIESDVDEAGAWSMLIEKYKGFIVGISAIAAVTMVLVAIGNFLKLGMVSSNPSERSKVITGIVFSVIAAALLGGASTFVAIAYRVFA